MRPAEAPDAVGPAPADTPDAGTPKRLTRGAAFGPALADDAAAPADAGTSQRVTRGAAFGLADAGRPAAPAPAGHHDSPSATGRPDSPAATGHHAMMTRAGRRRLALAEELAGLPEPVPTWRPAEASATNAMSRASRREAEHAARQRRRSERQRVVQPASLAAVASALIVATVVVDPVGVAAGTTLTDDDHLAIAEGAVENRGGAASRSGEREALPEAVEVAAAPEVAVEKADVVASATDALDRAASLVSTETRTTPEQREEVLAQAAVVRELSNRLAAGEAPAPADPELVDVVTAALMSAAVGDGQAAAAPQAQADAGSAVGEETAAADAATEEVAAGEITADGIATEPSDAAALATDEAAVEQTAPSAAEPAADVDLDDPEVVTRALATATARLAELLDAAAPVSIDVEPRPMTAAEVLAQQVAEAQADAPRLEAAYAASTEGFENGRIPTSAMAELSWAPGHFLRADAAAQLERLNVAFRAEFGVDIAITDSYRSFEGQVRARANRGRMAAVPGTSNHGWGVAVDLGGGINRFGTAQHRWLREHAEDFGWTLPGWARENGSKPEPWHWEFEGAPEVGAD